MATKGGARAIWRVGAVSSRPLGGVVVSGPGHGEGEEGGPWHHQLYHKGEWRFAISAMHTATSQSCI